MGLPPTEFRERKDYLNKFLALISEEKETQQKIFSSFKNREGDYLDHIQNIEKKLKEAEERQEIDSRSHCQELASKDFRHKKIKKELEQQGGEVTLKNFQNLYCLGEGGQETVNIMLNRTTNETFAGATPSEINFHKKLSHKHIIEFKGSWQEERKGNLILAIAENGSLFSYLYVRNKILSTKQIYMMFYQLCLAVEYLHSQDIMHSDLKLGNVLLDSTLSVKLSNFEVASEVISEMRKHSEKYDLEGRLIALEYEKFYLIGVYAPNSASYGGSVEHPHHHEKQQYRTLQWDPVFLRFLLSLVNMKEKPLVVIGDLNICHNNDLDVCDPLRCGIGMSSEITEKERQNFTSLLFEADLVHTFRRLYPDEKKWTYYNMSIRNEAGARGEGRRLDYALVSQSMLHQVTDSRIIEEYFDEEEDGSDHCPKELHLKMNLK